MVESLEKINIIKIKELKADNSVWRDCFVGKVFKPEDAVKRKKMIDEAVRDLSPGVGEQVKEILESWKGEESEKRLVRLLGEKEKRRVLRKVKFGST